MADPTPTPGATNDDPHGIRKDLDKPGQLVVVFLAVLGLALVNIFGSTAMGPGKFTLPFQLAVGSAQATLVGYHFMHLKNGDKVVLLTALSSIFWMGILFVLFLGDYMTRHMIVD
ncbi:MAG: hypothetical protein FJ304_03020 [Planctomycetes bacterium]|nr:hypothetical protein [Planctomycetota bacterium]